MERAGRGAAGGRKPRQHRRRRRMAYPLGLDRAGRTCDNAHMGKRDGMADQLRAAIREAGPVSHTAQRAGVDHAALFRFLDGRDIRLATAEKVADALGFELRKVRKGKG